MPDLATLADSFPPHGSASGRAYTVSMAFVCWIDEQGSARDLVAALETSPDVDDAFRSVLDMDARCAEIEWLVGERDEHSWLKNLLYSLNVWSVTALLAIVAILRHIVVNRLKKREMLESERGEDFETDDPIEESPR